MSWAATDTSVPPQVIFITEYVSSGSLKQFLKKTKKNHKAMNARVGSLGAHPREGAALCLLGGVSGLVESSDGMRGGGLPLLRGMFRLDVRNSFFPEESGVGTAAQGGGGVIFPQRCSGAMEMPSWGHGQGGDGLRLDYMILGDSNLHDSMIPWWLPASPSCDSGVCAGFHCPPPSLSSLPQQCSCRIGIHCWYKPCARTP